MLSIAIVSALAFVFLLFRDLAKKTLGTKNN